jgi:DNA-directed RNA polymerase subunit K/omega
VSALPSLAHPLPQDGPDTHTRGNRFLLSAIAFLRSKQLRDGARARVAGDGHKPTSIAVLEVLANTVSWSRVHDPGDAPVSE